MAHGTRRKRKRWLPVARGVVLVVFGAAASVLSAWVPAAIEGWRAAPDAPLPVICEAVPPGRTDPVVLLRWKSPAQEQWRTRAAPIRAADEGASAVGASVRSAATARVEWPSFLPVPEEKAGLEISSNAGGWPWMCLQRVTTFQEVSPGRVQIDFGPGREVWMVEFDKKWYMMPLRPIWPGLVGNAAVFAGALGVVWLGPGMARRAVRRAGGRCAACGYSLAGTSGVTCPECGAAAGGVAR